MSSGLVVIELEGNARPREPRRSRFDARAVRRGTSANGKSVRMCVASYTTVAPDAEPDGRQPGPGMTTAFHLLLNLHPDSKWPCYQKINMIQPITPSVGPHNAPLTTEI